MQYRIKNKNKLKRESFVVLEDCKTTLKVFLEETLGRLKFDSK